MDFNFSSREYKKQKIIFFPAPGSEEKVRRSLIQKYLAIARIRVIEYTWRSSAGNFEKKFFQQLSLED